MPRLKYSIIALSLCLTARADWKDEVGYTRLLETFTTGVPTAVSAGVTQAEAGSTNEGVDNYLPDSGNAQFNGKTITNQSSGSGNFGHATTVGGFFYGNTNSLVPNTDTIDAYNANGWLYDDFLHLSGGLPETEPRLVQNHSWISKTLTDGETYTINDIVTAVDLRLDYAVNQSGFICVAGVNNGNSTTLPQLLCQGYNLISVGLTNGAHSAGYTAYDGTGRIKPDIVAPDSLTSYATPKVSSAAGLLGQKLIGSPYSLSRTEIPPAAKALLLAGATKEEFTPWTRTTNRPLDVRYGAGELNVLLSYRILSGGNQGYSSNSTVADTAWSHSNIRSGQNRSYFFDIPAGSASQRFSAALVWHRAVSIIGSSFSYSLSDLNLRLYNATGFTRGTQIDESVSTVDNVEHLYETNLPAGRYELVVSAASGSTTNYALAWRTSPTVTVAAADAIADELTGGTATFTVARTGPTSSPLLVPLTWSGTAVSGSHYAAPPASVLISAGQTSATVSITPISDDIAQGDRSVTLTVSTDYSLSAGATNSVSATIEDKPFDAWRFTHFNTAQLADDTVSGDTADPDSDGLDNLLEYALDSDPLASAASTVTTALDGDRLTITYLEASGRTDLTYTVETCTDLTENWQSGATYLEETSRDGTANGEIVSVRRIATADRQFLRLRVSR